jgi:DNA-binding MarR family transcriptional regulator
MVERSRSRSGRKRSGDVGGDPPHPLAYRMKQADNALVARKAAAVRALGLTESQCKVLSLLADGVAKSSTQLARSALVTSQTMTGIVKNLETKGLVERFPSPDHARVMLVSLTAPGVARAAQALELAQHVERALRDAMNEDEYRHLLELLEQVATLAPGLTIGE